MTTKRGLITDSFKVAKKSKKREKQEKSPTPTPSQQDAATAEEEMRKLKQFDLDWRFGPCTGISRLQRWERAKSHGLDPPEEIRELLLETPAYPEYSLRNGRSLVEKQEQGQDLDNKVRQDNHGG
uniref:DNA polymerase delta 4, accessory subunit n=2 Tax=Fundulus heteroclitus TaxID=8078 RepID=A0A3Q2PHU6_FUNHE